MSDSGKILFVDDDEGILFAAEILLKRQVEEIRTESRPERLPELLKEGGFDAIFLDMNYSSGATSGQEGFHWLKTVLEVDPDSVVILMTAFGDVETAVQAIKRGATDFILKPWQNEKLAAAVDNAVALSRSRRAGAGQVVPGIDADSEEDRLRSELEYASAVQQRLFPQRLPTLETLECAAVCRAARGVGGDYYDFIKISDNQIGIALGDVSGKGIPAALLMANLQGCLHSYAPQHADSVDRLIADVNRLITTSTEASRYITFFYGLYDDIHRQLTYVNAGHNPPMLFRTSPQNGGGPERLSTGGTVMGVFADSSYAKETTQLTPGDVLVVFTDGVSEAMNSTFEEFGETRLLDLVSSQTSQPVEAIIENILREIDTFADPKVLRDDLTLLVAKVK